MTAEIMAKKCICNPHLETKIVQIVGFLLNTRVMLAWIEAPHGEHIL